MADVKDYPPYLDYPKERKKLTNADKIRQMTDEELAEFLAKNQKIGDVEQCEDGYRQLWLDWLKQEVTDK
jgi:hypothetical protein